MARHTDVEIHPERNPVLRLIRRVIPMTEDYRRDRLLIREDGRLVATPMLAALVLVATFDVVFAVDSIPAIFAVTRETFIVYAANAFSLLGLSALYFVLAGMIGRFRYLNAGLAAVLVFVGAKMVLATSYRSRSTSRLPQSSSPSSPWPSARRCFAPGPGAGDSRPAPRAAVQKGGRDAPVRRRAHRARGARLRDDPRPRSRREDRAPASVDDARHARARPGGVLLVLA